MLCEWSWGARTLLLPLNSQTVNGVYIDKNEVSHCSH
jgi:hypothetical protein